MSAQHYYNEIDPYCAAWLQNLMDAGHIPAGVIDTRSIEDVRPDELAGYVQCHFFAGIGGWPLALALAGWPMDRPVWTGSCPCQPFSQAGKGAGFEDERHLWPAWQHHIAQCRPAIVFGEQVAGADANAWIDLVHADLEGMAYAFGCVAFPAASIGAPHIRERTYWVADADLDRCAAWGLSVRPGRQIKTAPVESGRGAHGRVGNANGECEASEPGFRRGSIAIAAGDIDRSCPLDGFWADADWLLCTDGKWRPVEPGTFPLAHGISNRVGRLRAYGNAINPWQAAEFIRAYAEERGLSLAEAGQAVAA